MTKVHDGHPPACKSFYEEVSFMILGQNIWLVLIIVFIVLVILGVITVAA
jgi:hypothetical protein